MKRRGLICLLVVAAISAVASILTFALYPTIYKSAVKSNLEFTEGKDTSPSYSTFMLSNPPMRNVMKFYFFNVTNPDEMIFNSAKPRLVEIGPYAVIESEHKKYTLFGDNGAKFFYENYKRYDISKEESCAECDWDDVFTIMNSPGVGGAQDMWDPQFNVTPTGRTVISIALQLLGEYPFITQSVKEILFDGYNDPLLSAAHSPFIGMLNGFYGKNIVPIPIPDMPLMGFFQGYNNTRDENYWISTGTDDIDQLGKVITWGDQTALPDYWWTTDYARSIRGSDSGSFCKMHLSKDDRIDMFQSFMCRSFTATYLEDTTIHNIPSYSFSVPYEDYDTTSEVNKGFRYRNIEKVNYYPQWPNCTTDYSLCRHPESVDCTVLQNFCNDCCNKTMVGGTYLLPPGMYPLVCYPGRLQPSPFSVMYSPPHFAYSPDEVIDSVVGLSPQIEKHRPMVYNHETYSGSVTQVDFRLQVSMPIWKSPNVPGFMHLPISIVPMFWQDAHAELTDHTYHLLWLGFVFVPKFVAFLKFLFLALALFFVALTVMCWARTGRRSKVVEVL